MINVCVKEVIVITLNKRFWVKIHLKLCVLSLPFLLFGCAINDSNSRLVRFWNDGFIYSEKEANANTVCSHETNMITNKEDRNNKYNKCMKNKGYRR